MTTPFPVQAWWVTSAPEQGLLAKQLRPALRDHGIPVDAPPGLYVPLPGKASIFLDRVEGRRAEFALTGPELGLPFGRGGADVVAHALSTLLNAIVGEAGAVLAWAGTVREEFAFDEIGRFERAMSENQVSEALPLSLLDDTAWMRRWSSATRADIKPMTDSGGIASRDGKPATF